MNDLAQELVRRHFSAVRGELLVGGIPVSQLASNYGTPVFLYDRSVIDRSVRALREALPDRFRICFSVKANPNVAMLRHFLSLGCGLEVASAGEFDKALEAGCDSGQILFAGPGKSECELEHVLSGGIGEIHLESVTEAARVSRIAQALGVRARVALRVNPAGDAEGGAMRMGGRPAPFGVDEENLEATLDVILVSGALEFTGIHLFTGTQILDAATLINQYRHGLEIGRRVFQHTSTPLRRLDFGGGLGIPYFPHEKALNLSSLSEGLAALCAECERDSAFQGTEFLVEPGRFLVGEAGIYVARVNDIKISRGKKFLIVDGGMNHHLAASGNLGQTIKRNYPVALLNKLDSQSQEKVDVVGPLCTPLDTLARGVILPSAEIGDLFGVFQSGAYGRSASPLGFLSHPAPPEVFVGDGSHILVEGSGRRWASDNEGAVLHSRNAKP